MTSGLTHRLLDIDEAASLVRAGRPCCIAGDEAALRRLPRGPWIGGTIPYFMTERGGVCDREKVFVAELPRHSVAAEVRVYPRDRLERLCAEGPEHGFSVVVLPAFSDVHEAFSQQAPGYEDMYLKPLVGWVAGMHLDDLASARALVIDGTTGQLHYDAAVALHVALPESMLVQVDIVNLFRPDAGAVIEFDEGGFSVGDCRIDGQPANLCDWLLARGVDTRWPLVADYHGALINVSIRQVDPAARRVELYAPVFPRVAYRLACPPGDYASEFARATAAGGADVEPVFCCNCILNYLHGELQGRRTGHFHGPMTFGEIGYQLLNQTLVHLSVRPA